MHANSQIGQVSERTYRPSDHTRLPNPEETPHRLYKPHFGYTQGYHPSACIRTRLYQSAGSTHHMFPTGTPALQPNPGAPRKAGGGAPSMQVEGRVPFMEVGRGARLNLEPQTLNS